MLSGFLGLLGTVFGWIGGLLPDSPLSGYVTVTDGMRLGLAWLNWFLPISDMLVALGLWIAAMALFTAVKVAFGMTANVGSKVAGQ